MPGPTRVLRPLALTGLIVGVALTASAQPAGADDVRRRAARLRADVRKINTDTEAFARRLPALRKELEELTRQVEAVRVRKAEKNPQPSPEPKVREEQYRPPISRKSTKKPGVGVVCRGQKVYVSDIRAVDEVLENAIARKDAVLTDGGTLKVDRGDYDIKVTVTKVPGGLFRRLEFVLKPGSTGETLDQIRSPRSSFQAHLGRLDPATHNLQFSVYPDSYDTFRETRKLAWGKRFEDVGWFPFQVGETIRLGSGPVRVQ